MSKKDFYIYRFNLLQSYFTGAINNGKNFLNNENAYAFAWSHEIYPIFDACFADEEFEEDFLVQKNDVEQVVNLIDNIVLDYESHKIAVYPDYYSIQSQLGGKSNNLYLSEVLRYLYLSNRFLDVNLWNSILSNAPAGSGYITQPFNKNNDISIFLA